MKRIYLLLGMLALWAASMWAQTATDAARIIDNVYNRQMTSAGSGQEANARTYMNSMLSDGSWTDINYADQTMASWDAMDHWTRLDCMVRAYAGTRSSMRGNATLYNKIVSGFTYWNTRRPVSANWFYNWISWPQQAGMLMCIMRHAPRPLPAELEGAICTYIRANCGRPDSDDGERGQGANKMWVATQWIYRSALQGNLEDLGFAISELFAPIAVSTDTTNARMGLQADLSFLQHGPQLYTSGYGATVMDAVTVIDYITGTSYATLYADRVALLSRFFRLSLLPTARGAYYSYNTIGRSLTGPNSLNCWKLNTYTTPMARIDTAFAAVYNRARTRINGQNTPSFGVESYNRNFWSGDYMLHQRPDYSMDVRMVSTRTMRCESGNGDNMRGYFVGDGSTWQSQTGREYEGSFAMWEWSYVPGTTAPALTNSAVPTPGEFLNAGTGETNFAGGVSDGTYGAAAFHQKDSRQGIATQANKAWFFFDNEVVCMGSGIRSTNRNPLHTTLEQCILTASPRVENADGTTATLTAGAHTIDAPRWLLHGTTAYLLPAGGELHVSADTQRGRWTDISTWRSDTALHEKQMFRAWIDHGTQPVDARYIYAVVPAVSSLSQAKQRVDSLHYVNNDTVQAVYNASLQMVQAVFHRKGTLRFGPHIEVSAEQPCIAMFRGIDGTEVAAGVADPTHTLTAVRLYAKFPALHAKQLDATLPTGTERGSTLALTINAATPDSVFTPLTGLQLSAHAVALDAATPAVQLATHTTPANATPQQYRWTTSNDSVVAVTPDGSLIALGAGQAVVRVHTLEGLEDSCRVTVSEGLHAFAPVADAYVASDATGSNYGASDSLLVRKGNQVASMESYLRFGLNDVRALVADTAGVRVYLLLSLLSTDPAVESVAWNLYPVSGLRWSETGITWGNKPKATTTGLICQTAGRTADAGNTAANVVAMDVTPYVLSQIAQRKTGVAFNLTNNIVEATGRAKAAFASKESTTPYLRPRLVVQLPTAETLDHNGDGEVNLPDAVMVINKIVAGDQTDLKAYDHNNDSQINLPDAVIIINHIAGK